MLSRLVCSSPLISQNLVKSALQQVPRRQQVFRQYARDVRGTFSRTARTAERTSLKEKAMAPPGPNAYAIGKGALAGGAAIGLGALCFYGIGLGKGTNVLEQSHLWPEYVKTRIHDTYLYFAGSIAISAGAAAAAFRSPALMNLVSRNGLFVSLSKK